jgi:hypothetical protein
MHARNFLLTEGDPALMRVAWTGELQGADIQDSGHARKLAPSMGARPGGQRQRHPRTAPSGRPQPPSFQ